MKKLILIFLVPFIYSLSQPLKVISVSPSFNEISIDERPEIFVEFNKSIDINSINNISFSVYGERSAYHAGEFIVLNDNKKVNFISDGNFIAGERVSVNLTKEIVSADGDSLNGFNWTFRIPSKIKQINFSEPVEYGGGGYSMQCIDMNNDGSPDIVTSSGVIWINDGNGAFNSYWYLDDADGFYPIIVDDFNRDGFWDIYYGSGVEFILGLGNGEGNFIKSYYPWWFNDVISFDINIDGYPDLVGLSNVEINPPYDTTGYWAFSLNDGTGHFNDTIWAGRLTGSFQKLIQSDIDNDGDIDVLILSHLTGQPYPFPFGLNGFVLFKNDGYGVFEEYQIYPCDIFFPICYPHFIYSSDFNNDEFTDIAIIGDLGGAITLNKGNGSFSSGTDTTYIREFWGSEQAAPLTGGDLNGDGWIDLVISGYGIPFEPSEKYYADLQNLNGYFSRNFVADTLGNYENLIHSNAIADLNGDGYLDIVHSGNGVYITLSKDTITSVINFNSFSPTDFILDQNYPNPFNPVTKISWQSPVSSWQTLKVYDVLGREIAALVDEYKPAGNYEVEFDATSLSSGIYYYRLSAGDYIETKKMILIK